ncbi:MAG: HAD family hydrolase [Promethearchaeota archaeon]|nr:MAG: HAD family hydrolase [Candidatus Lokiarchaeota archaeon]
MKFKKEIKGILFDLDGTLLDIDLNRFLLSYNKHLHEIFPNSMTLMEFIKHHSASINKTNKTKKRNFEVFMDEFLLPFNLTKDEAESMLRNYYKNEYLELKQFINPRPESRKVVQHVISKNYKIVIATDPVFIFDAIKTRMTWAGIDDLPFDLITHAENFSTRKPNLDYFREIFSKIELNPEDCFVIGDDHNDMVAKSLGCTTFLIQSLMTHLKEDTPKPDFVGNLRDLIKLL